MDQNCYETQLLRENRCPHFQTQIPNPFALASPILLRITYVIRGGMLLIGLLHCPTCKAQLEVSAWSEVGRSWTLEIV